MKKSIVILAILLSACGDSKTVHTTETVEDNIYSAVISTSGDGNWTLDEADGFEGIQVYQDRIELNYSSLVGVVLSITTNEIMAYNHYFASGHIEDGRLVIYLTRDGLIGYYNPLLLNLDAQINIIMNGE